MRKYIYPTKFLKFDFTYLTIKSRNFSFLIGTEIEIPAFCPCVQYLNSIPEGNTYSLGLSLSAWMTEIHDSHNFEGKMLKPRKTLTKRSSHIFFLNGHKWTKF